MLEEPPVRLFVMGENRWRDENEWPLARTRYTEMFLHSGGHANSLEGDGRLGPARPGDEPADRYVYDPDDDSVRGVVGAGHRLHGQAVRREAGWLRAEYCRGGGARALSRLARAPSPIVPDRVYEYRLDLWATSHLFKDWASPAAGGLVE